MTEPATPFSTPTLDAIVRADDLHVSPFRADGVTYGTPTWIWAVAVGDDLFVRAFHGETSTWFQSAISQGAGRIRAAGAEHEVTFQRGDRALDGVIDAAYEAKYHGSSYLPPMLTEQARAGTVKISPRPTH